MKPSLIQAQSSFPCPVTSYVSRDESHLSVEWVTHTSVNTDYSCHKLVAQAFLRHIIKRHVMMPVAVATDTPAMVPAHVVMVYQLGFLAAVGLFDFSLPLFPFSPFLSPSLSFSTRSAFKASSSSPPLSSSLFLSPRSSLLCCPSVSCWHGRHRTRHCCRQALELVQGVNFRKSFGNKKTQKLSIYSKVCLIMSTLLYKGIFLRCTVLLGMLNKQTTNWRLIL